MTVRIPASLQISSAIQAKLQSAIPDVQFFAERSDQEPLGDSEVPGVVIKMINVQISDNWSQGDYYWSSTIQFLVFGKMDGGQSIEAVNQMTVARIIAVLFGDGNETLDGIVEEIVPESMDFSEQASPDVGAAVLQFACNYRTPRGDPFTLLTASR